MLVVVLGDMHIPQRALDVPAAFKKMLTPNKVQRILCTGNLTSKEAMDYLRTITPEIHIVKGDFDEGRDTPEYQVVKLGSWKVGIIHGHQIVPWGDKQSLAMWQRKLDVDVLIYGGTHQYKTFEFEGKLFINPGSITGAFSVLDSDVTPTFVLMDIIDTKIVTFVYQLEGDDLKVKKKEFNKPA
eukprot:TRINITY_DN66941_c2_g11_i1.p1 TRINITY_DN66941_c2_g11~~TRINITY_DN66941_c2_g11_i1.p1  ORF type:complete len:184 (-),score=21.48 TRINITY_DN66941_c2_g11_i1:98-649(-)